MKTKGRGDLALFCKSWSRKDKWQLVVGQNSEQEAVDRTHPLLEGIWISTAAADAPAVRCARTSQMNMKRCDKWQFSKC